MAEGKPRSLTRQVRFLETAAENLSEIAVHVAEQTGSMTIASNFIDRLREQCERLARLPGTLGTARHELRKDIRITPFQGYTIFFRYRDDLVEILAVLHSRRDLDRYFAD